MYHAYLYSNAITHLIFNFDNNTNLELLGAIRIYLAEIIPNARETFNLTFLISTRQTSFLLQKRENKKIWWENKKRESNFNCSRMGWNGRVKNGRKKFDFKLQESNVSDFL